MEEQTNDLDGVQAAPATIAPSPNPSPSPRLGGDDRTTVLIIGGGINGIATFRDLCLQGVDAILVERGDLSSGASSASSHMVHGGLRYLENGEMRLVQESVRERNALLRTAAHHVRPLATTIPLRRTFSGIVAAPLRVLRHRPSAGTERGALLAKLGLTLYDSYSRRTGRLPRHEFDGPRRTHERFPAMADDIRYTATYYDASVGQPERVAVDLVLDGLAANPRSRVLTYTEAVAMGADGVRVRDLLTGTEASLDADVIVNASGPWADLTGAALGRPSAFMGGTKGSHIVVDNPALLDATNGHEIFFEHPDGRIVLVYPLHGRVMIGTTDIPADPREPARCTDEEVDYFLELVGLVFPDIPVTREQIVYRFAGIRPLPAAGDAKPGAVSRDYRVEREQDASGRELVTIVGGKWTTFRALGERVTDEILGVLDLPRRRHTLREPIGGAKRYPRGPERRAAWLDERLAGVPEPRREVLFARYGTRAQQVAEHCAAGPDEPIAGTELTAREVDFLARAEHVRRVDDVLLRRTTLAFTGRVTAAVVDRTADALAGTLAWSPEQRAAEVERAVAVLEDAHGVRLGSTATCGGPRD
ncbi:glycerol-3-phosphate dehydrogenase/oxidase [Demequina sp. NBRC 110056]|uniref:glycerol-3-phosphate dehydrogenase/oxidase n=1 Tax=Demequina sp. NBRC 110056 TaxID=1570345 RepID=UPI0009FF057B|nr:glycerol-3-phosphate dehydrogenase/oxidase [Demequina sp. NBRC 110056]